LKLAQTSPCDPKTLNRAARDHLNDQPEFAMGAASAEITWIVAGLG